MAEYDDDAPLELLWAELRAGPLWQAIESKLLERRDRMVALMMTDRPRAGNEKIQGEDPMTYALRQERRIGYIEAVNAITQAPAAEQEKARKARIG